jgi:type IV secretory pathway VirB2 component (pilin)
MMDLLLLITIDAPAMQPSLSNPGDSSALVAVVQWIQGALLGSAANAVAVIAVAAIGFMMLRGRIDIRRGVTVIVGCFLLFGASSIAAAISGSVSDDPPSDLSVAVPSPPPLPKPRPTAVPSAYDPYAGASVPIR